MKQYVPPSSGLLLVFGGAYSNFSATQALIDKSRELGIPPENCICTGDVVAYCARPQETITAIRNWGCSVIMGNCEESLAKKASDCGCGFAKGSTCSTLSIGWYNFTDKIIDADDRQWMSMLKRELKFEWNNLQVRVVHGAPSQINRFIYASTKESDKRQELHRANCDVLLTGHSGIPFGQAIKMEDSSQRFWLNSGAIGLPANDGTSDGWYMLLNPFSEGVTASWHRLRYDTRQEQNAMKEAGLDNGYSASLLSGLWPSLETLPGTEKEKSGQPIDLPSLVLSTPFHDSIAHHKGWITK